MSETVLRRSIDCEVRNLDPKKRYAEFVATTEAPVPTWEGPEVLRMSGANLRRYKKNPVVLDSHNRFSLDSVIGKSDVWVEGRKLVSGVTYAPTKAGQQAWDLVEGGFVRAMSIGYRVTAEKVRRLKRGEFDGEGESRVEGPALVANEWELLETSNVPVPADEDALRRAFYDSIPAQRGKERNMSEKTGINFTQAMGERAEALPGAPASGGAAAGGGSILAVSTGGAPRADSPEERAAQVLEAKRRQILAITPRGLEHVAEAAILDGTDLEQARTLLKAAQAKRFTPVGTPEPTEPAAAATGPEGARGGKPLPEWATDDVIERSFENLR